MHAQSHEMPCADKRNTSHQAFVPRFGKATHQVDEPEGVSWDYAALSHCWGGNVALTTTSETIDERKNGIQWDSLPQTFQDAITVSQNLGIKYLWIDSLCILQDSKEDWEHEAARMAEVYHNAMLTIIGTSAASGSASFLNLDRESSFRPRNIVFSDRNDSAITLKARRVPPSTTHGEIGIGPLSTRGWAVQERALSRRILCYDVDELRYSCCCESRCECRVDAEVSRRPAALAADSEVAFKVQWQCGAWSRIWWDLIWDYTRADLTFSTDRLPALSGIAWMIEREAKMQYLAGLWKQRLPHDLCWFSIPSSATVERRKAWGVASDVYLAPSFSWASVGYNIAGPQPIRPGTSYEGF